MLLPWHRAATVLPSVALLLALLALSAPIRERSWTFRLLSFTASSSPPFPDAAPSCSNILTSVNATAATLSLDLSSAQSSLFGNHIASLPQAIFRLTTQLQTL